MPELPDVTLYVEALQKRLVGEVLEGIRLKSPFLLRSVKPPIRATEKKSVLGLERLGKRIVVALEDELFMVFHLMIAGRFRWRNPRAKIPGRIGLAAFDFPKGTLLLTEAGTKRRASLYLVQGASGLEAHRRGGLEILEASFEQFQAVLNRENHTLKRVLVDPGAFSGVGNAYSDEILHHARLSPLKQTHKMSRDEMHQLYVSAQTTLREWTERLRSDLGGRFPENVTAFREGMAVHGRYKQPCPECQAPVQRIVYAENETNYCPRCQLEGRVLRDRSLSRLLKADWPKTIEDLERN